MKMYKCCWDISLNISTASFLHLIFQCETSWHSHIASKHLVSRTFKVVLVRKFIWDTESFLAALPGMFWHLRYIPNFADNASLFYLFFTKLRDFSTASLVYEILILDPTCSIVSTESILVATKGCDCATFSFTELLSRDGHWQC